MCLLRLRSAVINVLIHSAGPAESFQPGFSGETGRAVFTSVNLMGAGLFAIYRSVPPDFPPGNNTQMRPSDNASDVLTSVRQVRGAKWSQSFSVIFAPSG